MTRLLYVRSPEASFRPEKYISDAIIKAARESHSFREVIEIRSDDEFTKLDNQRLFYDDTSMTRSFAKTTLEVTRQARDGDVIFFGDAWNPMIPAIDFHFHCSGVNVDKFGIFHSSVHTPGDFLATTRGGWASKLEALIVNDLLDGVFVATNYSKATIGSNENVTDAGLGYVRVTGLPLVSAPPSIDAQLGSANFKDKTIVFAHRWATDKRPEEFLRLAQRVRQDRPDLKFQVLHPVPIPGHYPGYDEELNVDFVLCKDRETYWQYAATSLVAVSTAELETFGYAILDSCMYGALPFVPRRACYPSMYADKYIYASDATIDEMSAHLCRVADEAHQIHTQYGSPLQMLLPQIFRDDYADLLNANPAQTIIKTILELI